MNYKILSGRFQPFHIGHLKVLQQSITDLQPEELLVIAVVAPGFGQPIDVEFSQKASEHLQPERNPWPVILPLQAVETIITTRYSEYKNKIITTIIPCPDSSLSLIKQWFQGSRTWIIPEANESFDNDKEAYYLRHNEKVVRYIDDSGVSGWELRTHFFNNDLGRFSEDIPEEIVDIYWKYKKTQ